MILGQQATGGGEIQSIVNDLVVLIRGAGPISPRQRAVAMRVVRTVGARARAGRAPAIGPADFAMLYNAFHPMADEPAKL